MYFEPSPKEKAINAMSGAVNGVVNGAVNGMVNGEMIGKSHGVVMMTRKTTTGKIVTSIGKIAKKNAINAGRNSCKIKIVSKTGMTKIG